MNDTNPIYLPAEGGVIGLVEGRAARLEPAGIPAGEALTIIVPGERVLVADAEVPPIRQIRRRHLAARYALEDQLAAPVDSIHLALGARNRDGTYPAAVVDKECMEDWLATLGDARRQATAGLLPDYLCLPPPADGSAELWVMGNRALLRQDVCHGMSCEQELLSSLLPGPDRLDRINVRVQADSDANGLLDRLKQQGYQVTIQDQPDPTTLLTSLLAGSRGYRQLNLLQGAYAPVTAFAKWWRPLRTTAALAVTWLVLATAAQGIYYYQLQERFSALRTQTEAHFRQAFPNVETINNIWAQAEAEVRQLRAALGTDGLFPLLSATARAVGGVPGLRMQSLQYRNGELLLTLRGDSIQDLEQLRTGFAQSSYAHLEIRSAEASDDGVNIRARVRPENA